MYIVNIKIDSKTGHFKLQLSWFVAFLDFLVTLRPGSNCQLFVFNWRSYNWDFVNGTQKVDNLYRNESKSYLQSIIVRCLWQNCSIGWTIKLYRWGPIKKLFLWSHDFQKFNFKLTARTLPVIPPKFTGVPVTQSKKIILM
jgi:hypothetical protein